MAGIYIHIPFCKTRCHYCDFYKSTDFTFKNDFLQALKKEIILRKTELGSEPVETIYFGGGTPSLLKINEIEDILSILQSNYHISPSAETTLEANPDDLSPSFIESLKKTKVTRLSIGTQSFKNDDLKIMNRRHNGQQAIDSVKIAQAAGFQNISIDLIYGLPNQSRDSWHENILQAIELDVQHISAYHLTYHEGTVFFDYLKSGKIKELPDELSLEQFKLLKAELENAGFEHYEISNFAKPGMYSKHNRAYWERKTYLGFGPSAHSFDLKTRRWNVSDLKKYLHAIEGNQHFWEAEILTEQDQYNDYMITSLRTKWGISADILSQKFDPKYLLYFEKEVQSFVDCGFVRNLNSVYTLSTEGLFISDKIMEALLFVE